MTQLLLAWLYNSRDVPLPKDNLHSCILCVVTLEFRQVRTGGRGKPPPISHIFFAIILERIINLKIITTYSVTCAVILEKQRCLSVQSVVGGCVQSVLIMRWICNFVYKKIGFCKDILFHHPSLHNSQKNETIHGCST